MSREAAGAEGYRSFCRAAAPQLPAGGIILDHWTRYLSVTAADADPPRLLRTVMFLGFVGHDKRPLKLPLPLFVNVPMKTPVAAT